MWLRKTLALRSEGSSKMNMNEIVDLMSAEIKQTLLSFEEEHGQSQLTPELGALLTQAVKSGVTNAALVGLRESLKSYEETVESIEKDGKTYKFKFESAKSFMTTFGKVEISRRLYQNRATEDTVFPLDVAWGMAGKYLTPDVREACLFGAGLNTPEEVEALLKKCALFHPSASTIKRQAIEIQRLLEGRKEALDEEIRQEEELSGHPDTLVNSLDGTNMLLDEPGKKKGRPTERPKDTASSDRTCYKNAMVGTVTHYKTETDDKGRLAPIRLKTSYVAHMPEDRAPTVKREWEQEIQHAEAQLTDKTRKLLLLDGSRGLWSYVENNPAFDEYEKAVDFFHVTEHLSLAAEALFGKSSTEAKEWYDKNRRRLLESDEAPESIIRSMSYYADKKRLSKTRQEQLEAQQTYFQRNKSRMRYRTLMQKGFPIGNGIVEAGCKSIIKQRFCRSGMRWSRSGGQAILDLRVYIRSNRWDPFYSKLQELEAAA